MNYVLDSVNYYMPTCLTFTVGMPTSLDRLN